MILWVLFMLILLRRKNLERWTHWKNKLLQPFTLMTCFQKVFKKFRELQTCIKTTIPLHYTHKWFRGTNVESWNHPNNIAQLWEVKCASCPPMKKENHSHVRDLWNLKFVTPNIINSPCHWSFLLDVWLFFKVRLGSGKWPIGSESNGHIISCL
jgi:hypothetical protein